MTLVIRGLHLVYKRNGTTMTSSRKPNLQTTDIDQMVMEMAKLNKCFTFESPNLIDSFCKKYKAKTGGVFDYPEILNNYQTPDGEFLFKLDLLNRNGENQCSFSSILHPEVNVYSHRTGCLSSNETPLENRNERHKEGCITLFRQPQWNANAEKMETISDLLKQSTQEVAHTFPCADLHPNYLQMLQTWHPPQKLPKCNQEVTMTTQTTYINAPELLPVAFDKNVVADGPLGGTNDLELDMVENDVVYLPLHNGSSQAYHLVGTIQHSG